VPLLHMVYGGNIADATQFGSIIEDLVQRYRTLTEACAHITLVFDKGNNSEENFDVFAQTGLHFVGSLKLYQCPDLLQVPLAQYRPLSGDGLEKVRAYRTRQVVFGQERTLLMTYNENLLAGQLQGIGRNLSKCRHELQQLQTQLRRWANGKITTGRRPTRESTEKRVQSILHREYMKDIIDVSVEQADQAIHLRYHVNQDALGQLAETVLGKTLLFTDNESWTDEQIIRAYRGLYHIEHAFREMKNPHFLGWNPRLHWTDQKIRVHAFYCVAALTFVSLLRRALAAKGCSFSAEKLLCQLANIRETISVYPQRRGKSPQLSYALSHLNDTQKQLFRLLNLERYRQS
jgi:transposase